jgi:hypothetical protein
VKQIKKITIASMKQNSGPSPLTKFLSDEELLLWLIREDLKCRKFFDGLRAIGMEDTFYQPELGMLILKCAGFENAIDDMYDFYHDLLGRHSQAIETDIDSVRREAFQVYAELIVEKKRLEGK